VKRSSQRSSGQDEDTDDDHDTKRSSQRSSASRKSNSRDDGLDAKRSSQRSSASRKSNSRDDVKRSSHRSSASGHDEDEDTDDDDASRRSRASTRSKDENTEEDSENEQKGVRFSECTKEDDGMHKDYYDETGMRNSMVNTSEDNRRISRYSSNASAVSSRQDRSSTEGERSSRKSLASRLSQRISASLGRQSKAVDSDSEKDESDCSFENEDTDYASWCGKPVRALFDDDECFYTAQVVEFEGEDPDDGAMFTVRFEDGTVQPCTRHMDIQFLTEEELDESQNGAGHKRSISGGGDTIWSAAERGDAIAVEKFINLGVDIGAAENGTPETTPLFLACQAGKKRVVKRLLQAGALDENGMAYLAASPPVRALMRDYGFGKAGSNIKYTVKRSSKAVEAVDLYSAERKHKSAELVRKKGSATSDTRASSMPLTSKEKQRVENRQKKAGIKKMLCF